VWVSAFQFTEEVAVAVSAVLSSLQANIRANSYPGWTTEDVTPAQSVSNIFRCNFCVKKCKDINVNQCRVIAFRASTSLSIKGNESSGTN
jgi:hypothetical protein